MLELPDAFDDVVEIGRGSVGVVYRAHQREFNRTVAVKVLTRRFDDDTRRRFEEERQTMGVLSSHPNIVTVYGSGTSDDGLPFIVMEYMPGGSLAVQLARDGPLPAPRAIEITRKLAGALDAAHRTGVLHRDVKPESVFVSQYGEPKLGDFGMARIQAGVESAPTSVATNIAHAAPEMIDGRAPSEASDVYSLASSAFAFLTGHAPFVRDTDQSVVPLIARIATEPVPVAELHAHGVPDSVSRVLADAMAKDPTQRIGTAAALASELEATTSSTPAIATVSTPATVAVPASTDVAATAPVPAVRFSPAPGSRSRRGRLFAIGTAAAAVILGVVVVLASSGGGGGSSRDQTSGKPVSIANVPIARAPTAAKGKIAVDVNVSTLNTGECWNDPGGLLNGKAATIPGVDTVRCTTPHDLEVFATPQMAGAQGTAYPGDSALNSFADSQCNGEFTSYVGRDVNASELTYYYTYPGQDGWNNGDRRVVCSLHRRDLLPLTKTAKGANI